MNYIPDNIFIYLALGMALCSCTEEKQRPVKNPFDSTIVWNRFGEITKQQYSQNTLCGNAPLSQEIYNNFIWFSSFSSLPCRSYSITQKNFYRFMDKLQRSGSYRIRKYQGAEDVPEEKDPADLYHSDSLFVSRFSGENYVLKLKNRDSVPLNITFSMKDKTIRMSICTNQKFSEKISAILLNKHLAKRVSE